MESIIRDICIYILNNLNDEIKLNELEEMFYYNKFYIIKIFKKYTGYTIKEFINTIKVISTINPLLLTSDTILKIALNHGFNSQEYYSEKFKEVIGIPPLKFRKEYNNIDEINDKNELENKKEYLLYLKEYEEQLLNILNTFNDNQDVKKLRKIS